MNMIPHGHTILVDPDAPPDRTDSGRIVLIEDQDYVATSGTVVAVGKGSKRLWEARSKMYRQLMDMLPHGHWTREMVAQRMPMPVEPTPSVHIGERVVFAAEAGLTVKDEDGHSYILLEEDRVAIIVEEEVSNVA